MRGAMILSFITMAMAVTPRRATCQELSTPPEPSSTVAVASPAPAPVDLSYVWPTAKTRAVDYAWDALGPRPIVVGAALVAGINSGTTLRPNGTRGLRGTAGDLAPTSPSRPLEPPRATATLDTTLVAAQAGVTDFQENMEALKHNFFLNGYYKKRGYEDSAALAANRIASLPQASAEKTFTYSAKQLFQSRDSARLKDQKMLNAAGDFLAQSQFGVAVVVVSTGMEGDTQKDLVLTQARAMVIREYLVENFGFDDSQLKTLGMGKQSDAGKDADWGSIQIVVFPAGTELPADTSLPAGAQSTTVRPSPAAVVSSPKP
jgi:outer membrane protein OmpA-like peptidoglycan-associated protein